MRRCMLHVISLTFCLVSTAQSLQQNYVRVQTMLSATGQESTDRIVYYDGIGRAVETVYKGVTPDGSDLVSLTEYASGNRISRQWLPLPARNSGGYVAPSSFSPSAYHDIYDGDASPYEAYYYENSPLDRVSLRYGAGSQWQKTGRGIRTEWKTNGGSGELSCRRYVLTSDGAGIVCKGAYATGSLHVVRSTDEDMNVLLTFSDMFGQKILERRKSDDGYSDTYFIYNDRGELAFMLPPAASAVLTSVDTPWKINSSETLSRYAYHYMYDRRGRCIRKKLPGCRAVQMVYDRSDRMVLCDDGNMREQGRQQFFLYDVFGREVVRGTCNATTMPLKDAVVMATYTGSGPYDGYSANISLAGVEIIQTTYYDDYRFISRLPDEQRTAVTYASRGGYPAKSTKTRSLPTGSIVHRLTADSLYNVSASYYDDFGRVVCQRSTNHLGGTEVLHTSYSFTSNPKKEYHRHTAPGRKPLTEEHSYSYDHADRLVSERISVNGGTATETSRHEYDELGRIGKTTLGNGYSQIHSYNLRGWLTAISGSMFSETMAYNATVDGLTPQVPSYSGNIAAMRWKSNGMQRGSQLRYDKLGRLTESSYGEGSTLSSNKGRFSERFTYDMMGNVLTVVRNGKISSTRYGCVDNLTLQYDGNQLRKVTDTGSDGTFAGAFDFDDGADEDVEYEYDRNGNMVKDLNKGISLIEYNCLNLPEKVEMKHQVNSSWVSYGYDGMGRKLYAEYSESLLKSAMPQ